MIAWRTHAALDLLAQLRQGALQGSQLVDLLPAWGVATGGEAGGAGERSDEAIAGTGWPLPGLHAYACIHEMCV